MYICGNDMLVFFPHWRLWIKIDLESIWSEKDVNKSMQIKLYWIILKSITNDTTIAGYCASST